MATPYESGVLHCNLASMEFWMSPVKLVTLAGGPNWVYAYIYVVNSIRCILATTMYN